MSEYIKLLPNLFNYIVPGFIFLVVFNFVISREEKIEKSSLYLSITISYVLISVLKFINVFTKLSVPPAVVTITLIFISILGGCCFGIILSGNTFKRLSKAMGIGKTIHKNIFNDITDKKLGNMIKIFLPSESIIYIGNLLDYEEKDGDFYLVISRYEILDYNEQRKENNIDDKTKRAVINTKQISRMELIYDENSEKI